MSVLAVGGSAGGVVRVSRGFRLASALRSGSSRVDALPAEEFGGRVVRVPLGFRLASTFSPGVPT